MYLYVNNNYATYLLIYEFMLSSIYISPTFFVHLTINHSTRLRNCVDYSEKENIYLKNDRRMCKCKPVRDLEHSENVNTAVLVLLLVDYMS